MPNIEKKQNSNIVLQSEDYINSLVTTGELQLYPGYSASNACKAAYIVLSQKTLKDGRPYLEVCTQKSVLQSIMTMCIEGLNPLKGHFDFVAYEKKQVERKNEKGEVIKQDPVYELSTQRRANGSYSYAKRLGLDWINPVAVHVNEMDSFEFGTDVETGRSYLISHKRNPKNDILKMDDLAGVYAIYSVNGQKDFHWMSFARVKKSWMKSKDANLSVHNTYPAEMAAKTIIQYISKRVIDRSNDSEFVQENHEEHDVKELTFEEPKQIAVAIPPSEKKEVKEIKEAKEVKPTINIIDNDPGF